MIPAELDLTHEQTRRIISLERLCHRLRAMSSAALTFDALGSAALGAEVVEAVGQFLDGSCELEDCVGQVLDLLDAGTSAAVRRATVGDGAARKCAGVRGHVGLPVSRDGEVRVGASPAVSAAAGDRPRRKSRSRS